MRSEEARSRCRRRILQLCGSTLDAEAIRLAIVDELRHAIGFVAWGWPLADPASLLPTTAIADRAMWPVVPRIVDAEERASDVNKDRELATSGDPVGILSVATRGDLQRSMRWREILGPHGFGDELRAACVDRFGCWGHLRLYREIGESPFEADDKDLLREVVPAVASALRARAVSPVRASAIADEPLRPGAVILDDGLRVRSWTESADAWFGAFAGNAPPRGPNARCAVFSTAARCVSPEGAKTARVRMRLSDGRWVVVEAARLEGKDRGTLVSVRAAAPREVLDLVGRGHGLTARERALVSGVADGLDTRELAERMHISPLTVQQHLKSVFDKVGVRSRRELVAGLFAQSSRAPAANKP